MSEPEEEIVTVLTTLFKKVEALQRINTRDILKPEIYVHYEQMLQAAYDVLTQVEKAVNGLGMKLEYHHWRLDGAMEELKTLLTQTNAPSDEISTSPGRK